MRRWSLLLQSPSSWSPNLKKYQVTEHDKKGVNWVELHKRGE
jgi:hypothetical protein